VVNLYSHRIIDAKESGTSQMAQLFFV